jgi:hypothetical protein
MNELTAARLRELLSYDPETGVFRWLPRPIAARKLRRQRAGQRSCRDGCAGGHARGDGYRDISIKGREYKAHNLAWLYMTGEWPAVEIDHINRSDNRWGNLREATRSLNLANTCITQRNTSGFKGVHRRAGSNRWRSSIRVDGKLVSLGDFASPERAFLEYCFAAWKYFGDYARVDADYLVAMRAGKARP